MKTKKEQQAKKKYRQDGINVEQKKMRCKKKRCFKVNEEKLYLN